MRIADTLLLELEKQNKELTHAATLAAHRDLSYQEKGSGSSQYNRIITAFNNIAALVGLLQELQTPGETSIIKPDIIKAKVNSIKHHYNYDTSESHFDYNKYKIIDPEVILKKLFHYDIFSLWITPENSYIAGPVPLFGEPLVNGMPLSEKIRTSPLAYLNNAYIQSPGQPEQSLNEALQQEFNKQVLENTPVPDLTLDFIEAINRDTDELLKNGFNYLSRNNIMNANEARAKTSQALKDGLDELAALNEKMAENNAAGTKYRAKSLNARQAKQTTVEQIKSDAAREIEEADAILFGKGGIYDRINEVINNRELNNRFQLVVKVLPRLVRRHLEQQGYEISATVRESQQTNLINWENPKN